VRNSDVYFGKPANWKTFPERLQEQGISWKVYQNEISLQNEISGNNENFLGNFTDNNLEWFEQYNVRYKKSHIDHYQKRISELPDEIADMQKEYDLKKDQKLQKSLEQKKNQLEAYKQEVGQYSFGNFSKLSDFEQELHKRAFQTNEGDPDYHAVEEIDFEGQKITVPKGDVLYQFRKDVEDGNLPTISWLCAPQVFSDHPSAPMYGAWYISEVLNILTARPEVWKKTIFVLNYDENDGYFDHIPPFVAPNVNDNRSGDVSDDLKEDLHTEFVTRAQELESGQSERNATEGPVGLGYRVPLIVASPWTRGGWVNSEVFDITSTIKFIETFINRKYGKDVFESNISKWRRAVSGDLTSVFRPYDARDTSGFTSFVDMKRQIAEINNAKNKPAPDGYYAFTQEDINQIIKDGDHIKLPKQEKGVKPSNALRYELYVDEKTTEDGQFTLHFTASKERFGEKSLAGVFNVYANNYKREKNNWSFAMSAGKEVDYHWRLQDFDNHGFKIVVHGPNGYYRYYAGGQDGNPVYIKQFYDFQRDEVVFQIKNSGNRDVQLMSYNSYTQKKDLILVKAGKIKVLKITTKSFYNWYDIEFSAVQSVFKRRYAGRLENGRHTMSDPLMGDG
jgi:phospholipase C